MLFRGFGSFSGFLGFGRLLLLGGFLLNKCLFSLSSWAKGASTVFLDSGVLVRR